MTDPRAENCRGYKLDANGKVSGVNLVYVPMPSTRYELISAQLIGEAEAAGNTVANCSVLTADGVVTAERIWLAWVFPAFRDGWLLPGNPNGQHQISNGFDAAGGVIGPLGIYPGDANHEPIGDIIGGLGLPNNRHVCYRLTWRERGAVVPPGGGEVDLTSVLVAIASARFDIANLTSELRATHADIERLAAWHHLTL